MFNIIYGYATNQIYCSSDTTKQITTRILISSDLACLASVVGKVNMSGNWCQLCDLSPKEWEEKIYEIVGHWN